MANKILVGRGTKARLETIKETLLSYELVYSMDTNELGVKNSDGTITYFGVVTELEWNNILNKPTFSTVATSGDYRDLAELPDLDLKLDKDFSALPAQTNPLLTDVLVLNRGTTVQKVTLGNLLAQVDSEIFKVVSVLPTTGVTNKIYLVPSDDPESIDNYVEWLWYDGNWERLGGFTLDLSNYFTKTEINSMLEAYVLQEEGKGLSTNNYTTTEKNKLSGIATGAEVNVQSDWNVTDTGSDAFIKNKPTIPTVPSIATKAEAEEGANNTKIMTPLRVKESVEEIFVSKKDDGEIADEMYVDNSLDGLQDTLELQIAEKLDKNNPITAAIKTKITYDAKGLVIAGADLAATDIPNLNASKITAGTFTTDRIPSLAAGKITYGTFDAARIPALSPAKITQDASNRFVTDTEKTTWNGKLDANSIIDCGDL